MKFFAHIFLVLLLSTAIASAEAPKAGTKAKRSKSLDFSGELVEGVNRQSMDSLVSFSQRTDASKKTFLYNKRDDFEDENEGSWRDLALGF